MCLGFDEGNGVVVIYDEHKVICNHKTYFHFLNCIYW